jgi:hypothetical protein
MGIGSGAVYAFRDQGFGWQSSQTITSPTPNVNDDFGDYGLAMDATAARWIVGEPGDDMLGTDSGTVHVFDSPCTGPTTYCTAKTNTLGCIPQIAFTGAPSATVGGGFVITTSNVINNRLGYLFYGTNGQSAAPFKGGTLCVRQPLHRTPGQLSGGTPAPAFDCSGMLSLDFNVWLGSSNDPTLFIGQRVQAQYWSRDSQASYGVSLTDALDFVVAP